jgi:hypothetical protein
VKSATKSCCSSGEASVQRYPSSRRDISSKSNSSTAAWRISAYRFPLSVASAGCDRTIVSTREIDEVTTWSGPDRAAVDPS